MSTKTRRRLQVTGHLAAMMGIWLLAFMVVGAFTSWATREQDQWVRIAAGAAEGVILATVLRLLLLRPWLAKLFPKTPAAAAYRSQPYD